MKFLFSFLFFFGCLLAHGQHTTLAPGQAAPSFALPGVDDKSVSLDQYTAAKGFIVVFTCNTCPYSKAYEQRLNALNTKYSAVGYPVLSINPNSPAVAPGESFNKMKEHARASKFNFPYLYDKDQVVTAAYGAKNTPHVFVVQKTSTGNIVQYTGAIDNDTPDTNPNKIRFVEEALEALLKSQKPERTVTKAIGCSVKWGKGR